MREEVTRNVLIKYILKPIAGDSVFLSFFSPFFAFVSPSAIFVHVWERMGSNASGTKQRAAPPLLSSVSELCIYMALFSF